MQEHTTSHLSGRSETLRWLKAAMTDEIRGAREATIAPLRKFNTYVCVCEKKVLFPSSLTVNTRRPSGRVVFCRRMQPRRIIRLALLFRPDMALVVAVGVSVSTIDRRQSLPPRSMSIGRALANMVSLSSHSRLAYTSSDMCRLRHAESMVLTAWLRLATIWLRILFWWV